MQAGPVCTSALLEHLRFLELQLHERERPGCVALLDALCHHIHLGHWEQHPWVLCDENDSEHTQLEDVLRRENLCADLGNLLGIHIWI